MGADVVVEFSWADWVVANLCDLGYYSNGHFLVILLI